MISASSTWSTTTIVSAARTPRPHNASRASANARRFTHPKPADQWPRLPRLLSLIGGECLKAARHSFSELQPPECNATPGPAGGGDSVLQGGFYLAGRELVAINLAGPARLREGVSSAEREFSLLAAKGLCSKREARDACAPFDRPLLIDGSHLVFLRVEPHQDLEHLLQSCFGENLIPGGVDDAPLGNEVNLLGRTVADDEGCRGPADREQS